MAILQTATFPLGNYANSPPHANLMKTLFFESIKSNEQFSLRRSYQNEISTIDVKSEVCHRVVCVEFSSSNFSVQFSPTSDESNCVL